MERRVALADTGLVVAYLDPDDRHHAWAVEQFERHPSFVTCEAVVAEACHLTGRRLGSPAAVLAMLRLGVLEVRFDLAREVEAVAHLMAKYADRPMDLADACLVRMSEQEPECVVLTVDGDFHVYRRHGREGIPVLHPGS